MFVCIFLLYCVYFKLKYFIIKFMIVLFCLMMLMCVFGEYVRMNDVTAAFSAYFSVNIFCIGLFFGDVIVIVMYVVFFYEFNVNLSGLFGFFFVLIVLLFFFYGSRMSVFVYSFSDLFFIVILIIFSVLSLLFFVFFMCLMIFMFYVNFLVCVLIFNGVINVNVSINNVNV